MKDVLGLESTSKSEAVAVAGAASLLSSLTSSGFQRNTECVVYANHALYALPSLAANNLGQFIARLSPFPFLFPPPPPQLGLAQKVPR